MKRFPPLGSFFTEFYLTGPATGPRIGEGGGLYLDFRRTNDASVASQGDTMVAAHLPTRKRYFDLPRHSEFNETVWARGLIA
jgi:hypothetical protein